MRVIERITNRLDDVFPVTEDVADVHTGISAVMATASLVLIEQTIEQADHHTIASHPAVFVGKVVLAGLTMTATGFFYDRSWKSQGK